jgi:hypothetical protein
MAAITQPICASLLSAFVTVALALVVPLGPASAQSSFDGSWSVLIITEAGDCDRAYRYGIRIAGGLVHYDGETGIEFSGRVQRDGRVTVTVRRGDQGASGSGRLSGNRGTGTWKGRSSTGECSGSWEAERRSSQ